VDQSDTQVLAALLHAVNHDPNVNVRLAAVDALRKFAGNPVVKGSLDQSLVKQDSPMVQLALIDFIVDTRDKPRCLARGPGAQPRHGQEREGKSPLGVVPIAVKRGAFEAAAGSEPAPQTENLPCRNRFTIDRVAAPRSACH
jgi:hypothetical protein